MDDVHRTGTSFWFQTFNYIFCSTATAHCHCRLPPASKCRGEGLLNADISRVVYIAPQVSTQQCVNGNQAGVRVTVEAGFKGGAVPIKTRWGVAWV